MSYDYLMAFYRLYSKTLSGALFIVIWVAFAPTQFGGSSGYVIVNGNSMEPGLYRGDLVVIRRAASYVVGDAVTCHHPVVGNVIHRIIAREGDRFVTQGDNNDFIDPYRPTQQDCIGKYWFHLPQVGGVLSRFRFYFLAFGVLAVAWSVLPNRVDNGVKRRRRGQRPRGQVPPMSTVFSQKTFAKSSGVTIIENALSTFAIFVVALGALAAFVFTRPLTREAPQELTYQHTGSWTYNSGTPSDIYDSGQAQAGDPIFRRLTDKVLVGFTYALTSDVPADVVGKVSLATEIRNSTGWKRSLQLQPERTFRGNTATITATLDLSVVQEVINDFETQTGLTNQDYTLAAVSTVAVRGTLAGQPLESTFSPSLRFKFSELQLSSEQRESDTNSLKPTEAQKLDGARKEPNTVSWLWFTFGVDAARRWLLICLVPTVLGLIATGFLYARLPRSHEISRIEEKHAALMVEVQSRGEAGVVDVADIADLVKLAEREGRLIFHESREGAECYWMHDLGITYRYTRDHPSTLSNYQVEDPHVVHNVDAAVSAPVATQANDVSSATDNHEGET